MSKPIDWSIGLERRKVLLGVSCLCAAGVAVARSPRTHVDYLGDRKLQDIVPDRIGDWRFVTTSGLLVPTEDELSRALYSQLLTRVYSDGRNPPIMLLIAQSSKQTGVLQVHRPEICYPAGGYQLSPVAQRALPLEHGSLVVNELTASADGISEHIMYWTRIGDKLPISWAEQRMAIALDNIRGKIPDAVLARVSVESSDKAAALNSMARFVGALIETSDPVARRVLIG